jgi:hypothetical protein
MLMQFWHLYLFESPMRLKSYPLTFNTLLFSNDKNDRGKSYLKMENKITFEEFVLLCKKIFQNKPITCNFEQIYEKFLSFKKRKSS